MSLRIMVLLVLTLSLAGGCGGDKGQQTKSAAPAAQQNSQSAAGAPQSGQPAAAGGDITLTIWETYNDEEHEVFLSLVEQYMAGHKGIKIKVQQVPYGGHRNKILTALATRTTPDIARIDNAWIPKLAPRKALDELDELGAKEFGNSLVKAAFDTCLYDNKVYGLPDQVTCLVLFYNKDMFTQAGLDPNSPPATWDQLVEYGKKLTNPAKETYGYAMGNTLWETLPFFLSFGAKVMSPDNHACLLNSPEAIQALQCKVDLYRKHAIEAGAWTPGAISPETGFKSKKYAMIASGPWNVQNFKTANINFGVALMPKGPAGSISNVGGTNMVIFRNCQHKKEAYDFLVYLTGPEAQKTWAEKLSQIPVNREALKLINLEANPHLKVFIEQIQTAIPIVGNPIMDDVENIVNPEMAAALKGDKTAGQALNDAVAAVNKKLAEAFAP